MKINQEKLNFQLEVIQKWKDLGYKGWLSLPPGLGKSYIAFLTAEQLLKNTPNASVLVIVPRNPLAVQWEEGYLSKLRDRYPNSKISVKTIQGVFRHSGKFTFIIWDELHRYIMGPEFSKAFDNLKCIGWMGLTGSVNVMIKQKLKLMKIPLVVHMSREEAIDKGFLTPTYIFNIGIRLSLSEEARLAKLSSTIHKESPKLMGVSYYDILKPYISAQEKQYIMRQIRLSWQQIMGIAMKVQRAVNLRNQIVDSHPQKVEIFRQFAEKFKERQILTFTKKTDFADKLTSLFPEESASYHSNINGIITDTNGNYIGDSIKQIVVKKVGRKKTTSTVTKYSVNNFLYTWESLKETFPDIHFKRVSSKRVKELTLNKFREGEIRILNSAQALQEGIDIPSIEACYESSRTDNSLTLIQEAGRLRSAGGIFLRAYLDTEYSSDKRKVYSTQEEGDVDAIDIDSVAQINV